VEQAAALEKIGREGRLDETDPAWNALRRETPRLLAALEDVPTLDSSTDCRAAVPERVGRNPLSG
jgi:hypothetical protein